MKSIILTFILCLLLLICAKMTSSQPQTLPLSMMDESVDDMYMGCIPQMNKKVKSKYFSGEKRNKKIFHIAWKMAKECAKNFYKTRKHKKLTKDHLQAICVYTAESPNVYGPFNAAVRESAKKYTSPSFQYHSLHFWLTTALQILNDKDTCLTTYRKTNVIFTGKVNQQIRFGSFTSTSKRTDLDAFGDESCFHIETCLGAYIKDYSVIPGEEEVLVPPYERFKITRIEKGSYQALTDCNTIFVLKHAGSLSRLNCKAA